MDFGFGEDPLCDLQYDEIGYTSNPRKRKRQNDTQIAPKAKRMKSNGNHKWHKSVMITGDTDGEQFQIYYMSQNEFDVEIRKCSKELQNNSSNAQQNNIQQLLDEIEKERINAEIAELNRRFVHGNDDMSTMDPIQTELWTDKYAPKRMTHLLSNEEINREVTQWVKQWDYIVFGQKYYKNKAMAHKKKNAHTKNAMSKRQRPEKVVSLFCGATGSGKSTLAHIVANHCGYRVIEINASNGRSRNQTKEIIINTATMKPMFGDNRPPLFVFDDMDDSRAAVDVVLSVMNVVNRPIICICNNAYSASLRPLRSICKMYKFRPISRRILCKRLLHISRKEHLGTDLKTLSYLANITNNDIRCCLHTLQFFKERKNIRLTIDRVKATPIGRKDQTQNIFEIWNKILKRNKNSENIQTEICDMMYASSDDNNKIMSGLMENYLRLQYNDAMFDITLSTAQYIMQFDELQYMISHSQHFTLMRYIPFIMVSIHAKCSTDTFQKLQYPSIAYKHTTKVAQNMNIVDDFLNNINSCIHYDIKSCVTEFVPLLPFIIFTHNDNDKKHFVSLIRTMIYCGLNYVKSSAYLELKPAIDRLSVYSFSKPDSKQRTEFKFMNRTLKEKIAHHIVLEIMRRNETGSGSNKYREKGNIIHKTPLRQFVAQKSSKHFIAAHNEKTQIEKYQYSVQFKFIEGYTNAVKRKSFCRDWV